MIRLQQYTSTNENKTYTKLTQMNDNGHDVSPSPSSSPRIDWSGRLISRILPLSYKGYVESNPISFRLGATELKRLIATIDKEQQHTTDDCEDDKKFRQKRRNGKRNSSREVWMLLTIIVR